MHIESNKGRYTTNKAGKFPGFYISSSSIYCITSLTASIIYVNIRPKLRICRLECFYFVFLAVKHMK